MEAHMNFQEELAKLAQLRETSLQAGDARRKLVEKFQTSLAMQEADAACTDAALAIEKLESEIKAACSLQYQQDKNKAPIDGIKVKVFTVTTVAYDPQKATEWARNDFKAGLVLDKKAFESLVVSGKVPAAIATVKIVEDPRVQIASDLRQYCKTTGKLVSECTCSDCLPIPF
jgi:hypothetical protein